LVLQNAPSHWELLYELACREILRSRQLYTVFDLLGQQFHEEWDDWHPWFVSYSGSHRYIPPVDTYPRLPGHRRDELEQRIWDYKGKLALKRGFADWGDFY
jgi:hypothetical protein